MLSAPVRFTAFFLLFLAGCSQSPQVDNDPPAGSQREPVSIVDCSGESEVFQRPPQRVVTMVASVGELLFSIGVGDRIVGTGFPYLPGNVPPPFAEEISAVPTLAFESYPSKEVLLGANPDLVLSNYPDAFEGDLFSRQELQRLGINTYLTFSTICAGASAPAEDLSPLFRDLRNLGRIFDVEAQAERVINQYRDQLRVVQDRLEPITKKKRVYTFEYEEGAETPYGHGNRGTFHAITTLAGGVNIFGDEDTDYIETSWEELVDRDPEVIVIVVYDKAKFDDARRFLQDYPPAQSITAVRENSFVEIQHHSIGIGGIRNVESVEILARHLYPDLFTAP